jgi:transcriptional regulator with PAS, ATPase and Fis domain
MESKAKLSNNKKKEDQLISQIEALQDRIKILENDIEDQQTSVDEEGLSLSRKNMSDIIRMNADGIIIVDNDGAVLYVNPAAEDLFGKKKEDFINYPFGFPVSSNNENNNLMIINEDIIREVELRVVQVQWKGQAAYQLSVRDITERKEAERKIEKQLDELKRWNEVTLGREMRIIDLKGEVNELLALDGKEMRYPSVDSGKYNDKKASKELG